MNSNLKFKRSLIVFFTIISFSNAFAQIKPLIINCPVYDIDCYSISAGNGAGQLYPSVTATTLNNCTTFTVTANYNWLHFTKSGRTVTFSVDANTGSTRSAYVWFGSYDGPLTITQACGNRPGAAGTITGTNSVCRGQSNVSYSVASISGATGYSWSIPPRSEIASGGNTNSITVNYLSNAASGSVSVQGTNSCGSGSPSPDYPVTVNYIAQPGAISGTTPACAGSTYTYSVTPVTGAVSYTWTIPTGASGSSTSNSINVTFGTQSGTISVVANNSAGCVSTPSTLSVTVNYLNQYSVIGTGTTCPGVGIPVSLQGSTNGITYKCYLNGSWQSGDMITGNGGNNVSWNKYAPGTYTITGVSGTCEVLMSGSAVISNYTASTDPTSVTANANPMCYGAGTTLTVHGGSLGTNANWNWYTAGCGVGTPVGTGPTLNINPPTTTTYWVKPVGLCGTNGCASITITVTNAPVISIQPVDVHICDGAATSFTASAAGSNTYQWQYLAGSTWTNISGATSSTYNIPSTTGMGGRVLRCAVTNSCFTTNSNNATIFFNTLVAYSVLGDTTICPGDQHKIRLNGSDPNSAVLYRCYLNGSQTTQQPVHGTGGPISFSGCNAAGVYTVKGVTSPDGCLVPMSGSATVTVRTPSTPATSITSTQPIICPGGSPGGGSVLTLSGGSLETGYGAWHWYSGGTPCGSTNEGTGTTSITVNPMVTTTYSVRAEGGCVITSCANTTMNIKDITYITYEPQNSNINLGSDAVFSLIAIGPNLHYQWQVSPDGNSWTDLTGLPAQGYQTSSLTIKGSTSFEDNYYQCRVISDCSTIYSDKVKIVLQYSNINYLTGNDIPNPETRALNTSYLVGATSGSFNVNPMGGASYSLPIVVPPGVNGLGPELSISYSSSGGSGIAGFGWHFGGISSISRGPQTIYNDGEVSGVNLDINDRFYLDGQRLVNTSSTYGASDAQYQTENDIFTRITPEGTDSNGPGWFKAETKSGLTYEYGNITASKQVISGHSQVLNWFVSKISDLFGNHIDFSYIQDHHSVYPSVITYGPNTITFAYKQRSDKMFSFLKGGKIEQWLLLDKIIIKYNSNIVKTYEFKQSYQGSDYNSYSILNEIIEYGIGTSRLNSTAISYQMPEDLSFELNPWNTTHRYITSKSYLYSGDFNGDGKADFLCVPDTINHATWTGLRIFFGDGNGNFQDSASITSNISIHYNRIKDLKVLDLNGDGIDDILYEYTSPSGNYFRYIICDGTSLSQPVYLAQQTSNAHVGYTGKGKRLDMQEMDDERTARVHRLKPTGADYNGDGINDIFINTSSGDWSIRSFVDGTGQLTSSMHTLANGYNSTLNGDVVSGDFNGDGKSDLWSFENDSLKIYTLNGTSLVLLYKTSAITNKSYYNLGDFNADGKIDIFVYGGGKGTGSPYDIANWQIYLSTGGGFEVHSIPQLKSNMIYDYVRSGDFNGDGAIDLMVNYKIGINSYSNFYFSKNNGTDLRSESFSSSPNFSYDYYCADFNGDGSTEFICSDPVPPCLYGYRFYKNSGKSSILMDKVANGLGSLTKLVYTKLSQASSNIYQPGTGAIYPVIDFHGPLLVVSSVRVDNGIGSKNTYNYYYEGPKMHLQGKGFLGFVKTIVTDVTSGIETGNIFGYNSSYYYSTSLKSFSKLVGTTDTIERVSNSWSHAVLDATNKRIFPYIQSSAQVNKLTGFSVSSSAEYDNYGNPTSVTKAYSNGPSQSTSNTYDNTISSSQWLLGRPTATTIQFTSDTTITRSGTRVFANSSNQLTSETWYSGTGNEITKFYVCNTNGTLQSQTTTTGSVTLSSSCTYESDNIRIHSTTDQLSHLTTNAYDIYGRLYTQQNYWGNSTSYGYDELGRQNSITSSDGSQITTAFGWQQDTTIDPVHARYSVEITGNNGSEKKSWYDKLGRELRSDVKGFDGTMISTATNYNTKGQVESVSEPYFSGGSPQLNSLVYDDYGRKTSLTKPSGRNTSWDYNSNIVTETTGGKSYYKTYSSDGTISSATDNGGTITYTYYPDGKSRTITAPGGNVTNMYYDLAGNQKKLVDPSAGTIRYTYNGFCELTSQINPGHKSTTISYLADGRISQKVTNEGTTKYRYNTNKQLRNTRAPGNTSKTFRYDSKGRVISVTDTIPGTDTLRTAYSYDNFGRSSTITHPSGIVESYTYSNGFLSSVSTGDTARWTINSMNARQQITTGQYANNLNATMDYDNYGFPTFTSIGTIKNDSCKFDPVTGNMKRRRNNKYTGLIEVFHYDNLDRLTTVQMNDTIALQMTYDGSTGSILSKSDAGTFNYDNKPYSISSIDPSIGFTAADTADAQSINYTSSGSVNSITEKNFEADFIYNSDNDRVQMLIKQNGSAILTRWYSGGGYIKEIEGSTTREYTFIGGDAYSAPVVAITQGGTTTYYDLLRDNLGSITHVVNSSTNAVVAEYSYDAWGRMRNPTTWVNYPSGSAPALIVAGRGYTGHEHLPWFNMINMNGRLYDPLIAMFLSPDNYVQEPTSTQNYNRYAYCLNNPLKSVDPSGMSMTPIDEELDTEFRQYFDWLCDRNMNSSDYGGSGGGGPACTGADPNYAAEYIYASNVVFYGYTYNWSDGVYTSRFTGQTSTFDEVYNNYVVPNSCYSGQVSKGCDVGGETVLIMKDGIIIEIGELFPGRTENGLGGPHSGQNDLYRSYNPGLDRFKDPTGLGARLPDNAGSGFYGAGRKDPDGTTRYHLGLDFISIPGQNLFAPISGRAYYYSSSSNGNTWCAIRIFPTSMDVNYIDVCYLEVPESYAVGDSQSYQVTIGQIIGTALDLHSIYPDGMGWGMQNHVHVQVNSSILGTGNRWVDPFRYFYDPSPWFKKR
jgi:RHS repeat-associated protein